MRERAVLHFDRDGIGDELRKFGCIEADALRDPKARKCSCRTRVFKNDCGVIGAARKPFSEHLRGSLLVVGDDLLEVKCPEWHC